MNLLDPHTCTHVRIKSLNVKFSKYQKQLPGSVCGKGVLEIKNLQKFTGNYP